MKCMTGTYAVRGHEATTLSVVLLLCLIWPMTLTAEPGPPEPSDGGLAVLLIGNSFSGNAGSYLPYFARAGQVDLVVGHTGLGGASLERHVMIMQKHQTDPADSEGRPYAVKKLPGYEMQGPDEHHVSLREALTYRSWDVVSIQQASVLSVDSATYEPFATQLIELIRETNPAAEIVILQTWAYRYDSPFLSERLMMNQTQMHEKLSAAYDSMARSHNLRQVPIGDAFALARRSQMWDYAPDPDYDFAHPPAEVLPNQDASLIRGWYFRDGVLTLDGNHASIAGRYLGGCVWWEILYGDTLPIPEWKPRELSEERAVSLREIARQAVAAEREQDHHQLQPASAINPSN